VKQRTGIFGIVLLLVLFASGAFVALRLMIGGAPSFALGGRVAILPITGLIESEREFVERLERFSDDGSVRAFLLEIRSPGGYAAPSQAIYEALRALRETDERPLVAWIGEVGASGGYYAALPADTILAMPSSVTGSIGVVMTVPNAGELLGRWGLEVEVIESGPNKDPGGFHAPLEEEGRRILQTLVDDTHEQFVDAVAASRPLTRDSVLVLADGRVMSGARAADAGLIDRTGTLEDALAVAGRMADLGDDPRTVRPDRPVPPLFERLWGGGVTASVVATLLHRIGVPPLAPLSTTPSLRYEWR
jgi:protease-4